jgi:Tfp pilus assembly protein PilF
LLKDVGLNPNDFSYACLGVVCFHLEKHDDAKKHLVRALELNPHFSFTDVPNPALDFAQNKLEEVRKARASTQLSTSCSSSAQAG